MAKTGCFHPLSLSKSQKQILYGLLSAKPPDWKAVAILLFWGDIQFPSERADSANHTMRRYGSVPHSGFGMGIERAVAWICGLDHVRETIPFARTLNRIYP